MYIYEGLPIIAKQTKPIYIYMTTTYMTKPYIYEGLPIIAYNFAYNFVCC